MRCRAWTLTLLLFCLAATANTANNPWGVVKGVNGQWPVIQCGSGTTIQSCTEHWVLGSGSQDPPSGFGFDGDLFWRTDLVSFRTKTAGVWGPVVFGTSIATAGYYGPPTDNATLGSELATNPSFTGNITGWSGTNWAYEASNKARHIAGSTAALTQNVTLVLGTRYLVSITQTGRTAGSFQASVGSQTLQAGAYWDEDQVFESTQAGSVALSITPTTDFDGALTKVSIKPFATLVALSFNIRTTANGVFSGISEYGAQFRFSGGAASPYGFGFGYESLVNGLVGGGSNIAMGDRALEQVTTGYWNVALGYQALWHDTGGIENTATGKWALANNTVASFNQAYGNEALLADRNSSFNAAFGWRSLTSLTTGAGGNVAVGPQAGRGMTSGFNNVCVGNAACWAPAGLSANFLDTTSNNTYVGFQAGQASTTQRTNSGCFGANCTVNADNTIVLGDQNVTDVYAGLSAQASIRVKSVTFTGVLFASLGTPNNGVITYCSDCTIANPCAGSGGGALAKRLGGAWVCN